MSTILAVGNEYEYSMKAGATIRTSTAQYKVGYIEDEETFDTIGSTATARTAFGVNQSEMSANSIVCLVRRYGLSKVICGGSVTAGQYVVAYEGVSTTTHYGSIQQVGANGTPITAATASVSAQHTVLGVAIENGQTDQAIYIDLNPQLYDQCLLAAT